MADLTDLPPKQLKELAKALGMSNFPKTKAPLAKAIEKSYATHPLVMKTLKEYETAAKEPKKGAAKKAAKKTQPAAKSLDSAIESGGLRNLELRLGQIEKQIAFLMDKVAAIESHMGVSPNPQATPQIDSSRLQKIIMKVVGARSSITVDDLLGEPMLRGVAEADIGRAVVDLIDQGVFDVSDANSRRKINGNIGLLIPR